MTVSQRPVLARDPAVPRRLAGTVLAAVVGVVLAAGLVSFNHAAARAQGRLEQLRREREVVAAETRAIQADIATLLSPESLDRLARTHGFVAPGRGPGQARIRHVRFVVPGTDRGATAQRVGAESASR